MLESSKLASLKKNRIISQGYNGYIKKCPHEPIIENNHNIATIHAEQNAIGYAARNGIDTEGCSIYCTQSPCISCAKLSVASGIKEFYYISNYRLDDGIKFLDQAGVSIKRINNDS